jgi:hypothetical protein
MIYLFCQVLIFYERGKAEGHTEMTTLGFESLVCPKHMSDQSERDHL